MRMLALGDRNRDNELGADLPLVIQSPEVLAKLEWISLGRHTTSGTEEDRWFIAQVGSKVSCADSHRTTLAVMDFPCWIQRPS